MSEFVYNGAECLSGECPLCNHEHPKHKAALAEMDRIFGSANPCKDCGGKHMNGGDALACDHILGRHSHPLRGCPLCAKCTEEAQA